MSANEAGWLLALMWGVIAAAMLTYGGITSDLPLVLSALVPSFNSVFCMWWAEENA